MMTTTKVAPAAAISEPMTLLGCYGGLRRFSITVTAPVLAWIRTRAPTPLRAFASESTTCEGRAETEARPIGPRRVPPPENRRGVGLPSEMAQSHPAWRRQLGRVLAKRTTTECDWAR